MRNIVLTIAMILLFPCLTFGAADCVYYSTASVTLDGTWKDISSEIHSHLYDEINFGFDYTAAASTNVLLRMVYRTSVVDSTWKNPQIIKQDTSVDGSYLDKAEPLTINIDRSGTNPSFDWILKQKYPFVKFQAKIGTDGGDNAVVARSFYCYGR